MQCTRDCNLCRITCKNCMFQCIVVLLNNISAPILSGYFIALLKKKWTITNKWYQSLKLNMSQFTNSEKRYKFLFRHGMPGERNHTPLPQSHPWIGPTIDRDEGHIGPRRTRTKRGWGRRGRAMLIQVGQSFVDIIVLLIQEINYQSIQTCDCRSYS